MKILITCRDASEQKWLLLCETEGLLVGLDGTTPRSAYLYDRRPLRLEAFQVIKEDYLEMD